MGKDEGNHHELSKSWNGGLVNPTLFYNALNPMSKSMPDTTARGTFMSKPVEVARRILDDMQSSHAQCHVERSSSRKVNAITEGNN
jgi:hypothetical protein